MAEMCIFPSFVASFAVGSDDVDRIAGRVTCWLLGIIPPHSVCKSQTAFPRFLRFAFHLRSCVASGSLGGTGFCGIAGHVVGIVLRAGRFVCDCVRLKIPFHFLEGARVIRMRQFLGGTMQVSDAKPIRMLTFESTRYPFLFLRFVPLIHLVVGEQDTKGFADQMLG